MSDTASPSTVAALTAALREAARTANNETELRLSFEPQLKAAIAAADWAVHCPAEHEKAFASGHADSVFGQVVVEYKAPGRLGADMARPANREARAELERYLSSHARGSADALHRSVGVAVDGHYIFFLRFAAPGGTAQGTEVEVAPVQASLLSEAPEGTWRIEGPYEVSEGAISQMLHYLRALARKPLRPDTLSRDFGPEAVAARAVVNALYGAFRASEHPKKEVMFGEWDRIFGIVYGQDIRRALDGTAELAAAYGVEGEADLKPLLFCVHTYFALFIKLLVAELMSQRDPFVPSFVGGMAAESHQRLRRRLMSLEEGGIYLEMGIQNFLEGDFFGWFLAVYDDAIDRAVRTMLRTLQEYEPATPRFLPEETRDLLKQLYQFLVPKRLRHDLGEYYTPDWLADLVLDEVGYDGDPDRRVLDPGCGSGTFLVLVLRRVRERMADRLLEPAETLQRVLHNVVGFDLNPLAVIAARANYLLALGDLVSYRTEPVRIPVYLCDSVLTPARDDTQERLIERGVRLRTVVGPFDIPEAVIEEGCLGELADCIERCVRDGYEVDAFLDCARDEIGISENAFDHAAPMLGRLFARLVALENEGRNRVWARLIKNAFAPIFQGCFDFVVGNPPWVNWESLADEYREATKGLWVDSGLFSLSGSAGRLGGGKKDLSMLFVYVGASRYLKPDGLLSFVITQPLFKSEGAGDGFRRFRVGDGVFIKVARVHDMAEITPFPGVGNRTAVFTCGRSDTEQTAYPVEYILWEKHSGRTIDENLTLAAVMEQTERHDLAASPINADRPTSPWLTGKPAAIDAMRKAIGPSAYRAHEGFNSGGLNGVYWLEIIRSLPTGEVLVRNLADVGRKDVEQVERAIEPDLLYPLLRGRDIQRWNAQPSCYALVPQDPDTRIGWPVRLMQKRWPRTYSYLRLFEAQLLARASSSVPKDPFYSVFAVGDYTFAPWKLVWRDMGGGMVAAAVGSVSDDRLGARVVVPEHHVMMVACADKDEALYLSAVLNSAVADLVVRSYAVSTQISTHVLNNVSIPAYDEDLPEHGRLAELSRAAHGAARGPDAEEALAPIEAEIDCLAATLWGITESELAAIRETLDELPGA